MSQNSSPCQIQVNSGPCIHWEAWDIPEGHISLPRELSRQLTEIRAEHAAWAYDTAYVRAAGRTVADWLKAGDSLSMWWCSLLYERHPKMTPNLYTIYKLRTLERLLVSIERELPALRPLSITLRGGTSLLSHTLATLCETRNWKFTKEKPQRECNAQSESIQKRIFTALPPGIRACVRYVHWWWTVKRRFPSIGKLPQPQDGEKTATIATYFPNVDMDAAREGRYRSRYWESLHETLAPMTGRLRWLFIRFPAPQMTLDQCIAFRGELDSRKQDGLSFVWLEECLQSRDLWGAWKRFLRLRAASLRIEDAVHRACHFAGSKLNFWPFMRDDYAESFRGWRALERCLQARGLDNYVQMVGPQQWTLFPLENCPWERMLTHAIHTRGNGPVYGAQHSTIRPTDFRYFDDQRLFADSAISFVPDAICGNGTSACGQWRANGVPKARLHTIEALRYLYLGNDPIAAKDATKRELLVLTSFFRDETFAHLSLLAQAVQVGYLQGWQITLKAHPYLPAAELLQHFPGDWSKTIQVADGPIAPLLKPGILVWAANSTTAALEAAIKGLAVMVMQPSGDFDLCPMQDIPELVRTATVEDVRLGLATAKPLNIDKDYLKLDTTLVAWRSLLQLPVQESPSASNAGAA